MTTKRLYYDDAVALEFTAEVLSCEPGTVAALETPSGALATPRATWWRVKLDRTAFYPTSGGQPADTGRLGGACRGGAR
jgi:alanyl-tRNA synthetase